VFFPDCEAGEATAKIVKEWSYTSSPSTCFHGVDREIFHVIIYPNYPSGFGLNADGSTPDNFNTVFQELRWNFLSFMNSETVRYKSGVCYKERCYDE
jgi:hypothetical protein